MKIKRELPGSQAIYIEQHYSSSHCGLVSTVCDLHARNPCCTTANRNAPCLFRSTNMAHPGFTSGCRCRMRKSSLVQSGITGHMSTSRYRAIVGYRLRALRHQTRGPSKTCTSFQLPCGLARDVEVCDQVALQFESNYLTRFVIRGIFRLLR